MSTGLTNPSAVRHGELDSDDIGPWTRWNGNLNAEVMVIGQEWGDVASFERQGGIDTDSATNRTLRCLLDTVGVQIAEAPIGDLGTRVFLTNAALCLKQGGAQAPVKKEWFHNCGKSFLRQQIELVHPRVVVTLGEQAYLAVRREFSLPRTSFRRAARSGIVAQLLPAVHPLPAVLLVPVYHCGNRILRTHRRLDEQELDWKRVRDLLERRIHDCANGGET